MRVVVSTEIGNIYSEFVVVKSFSEVLSLEGVELIVLHTFEDSEFDVGTSISELYSKTSGIKIIYINDRPNATVRLAVEGMRGIVSEDTFVLDDEEELKCFLADLDEDEYSGGTAVATTSVQVVKDFVQSFTRKEERINSPAYLAQVNTAIDELARITEMQHTQLSVMGESALSVFKRASDIITQMSNQRQILEQQLKELETTNSQPVRSGFGGGITAFPSYKYTGISKVLFIREVSPCRYLTSFILAYEHYLHYEMNKRCKVVYVYSKSPFVSKKYDGFTTITQESAGMSTLYDSEIIATNNPKQDVMKKIFSKGADVYIVVDRLYGNADIVQGRVKRLYAVGGLSDLTRYKLQKSQCIFPVSRQDGGFLTIPTIKSYPVEEDTRYAAYGSVCRPMFERLDEFLELPKE